MDVDAVFTEARARITWGEDPLTVREFLIVNGVPDAGADAQIKQLLAERNRDIRRTGIKDACIGAALIVVAAVLLWLIFTRSHVYYATRTGRAAGGLFLLVGYGIWRLIKGVFSVLRPEPDPDDS